MGKNSRPLPPPVDNAHVEEGAEQFDEQPAAPAPAPTLTVEDRLLKLEHAFHASLTHLGAPSPQEVKDWMHSMKDRLAKDLHLAPEPATETEKPTEDKKED